MHTTPLSTLRGVLSIFVLFITFALAVGWGAAQAAGTLGSGAPFAQVPTERPTIPLPAPSGVATFPIPEPSIGPSTGGSTDASSGGGFPWLIAIILATVAALGVIAVLMMRNRSAMAPAGGPRPMPPDPNRVRPVPAPPAPRPDTGAATTPIATGAVAGMPATLTCPNCKAENDWNENFCHDCGQDLRPVRASLVASMAPPVDEVTDDMPYLETLDRTDEQLEYVLSRSRIVMGSAAGCDIMIDPTFANSGSVAPRHAQLTRNADGSFSILDLGAPGGTFVNDTRLDANGSAALTDGAQISVGGVRFVYRVP